MESLYSILNILSREDARFYGEKVYKQFVDKSTNAVYTVTKKLKKVII